MTTQIVNTTIAPSLREVYDRRLATKALAEFCHEQTLRPAPSGSGQYTVTSDDGRTEYSFAAEVISLDSWIIDPETVERTRDGERLAVRSVDLIVDLHRTIGIDEQRLPEYLEELISTLAMGADRPASRRISAADLAVADFQTVETTLTEGHPCFIANAGRLGFSSEDLRQYAPESGAAFRLVWLAALSTDCDVATMSDIDYRTLLRAELGESTLSRFASILSGLGLDPDEYTYLPAHPWQWTERIARLYAGELADRRIVYLTSSDDLYQPQQSIRTAFNCSDQSRNYVKTALSIVNMGFTRGMSADYMRTTPLINDWVRTTVGDDEYLRGLGFEMLFEVAAVGYRSASFTAVTQPGSEYRKLLAALWRQSPIPLLASGERPVTMAALLHLDHRGDPLIGEYIALSGLSPADWIRRYLRAYLHPITHLLYQHQLKFSPHGENLILVLVDGTPVRAILKDIGEEVCIVDTPSDLPADCARALTDQPDAIGNLGVLSDIFDDFFRPLAAILHAKRILTDSEFWAIVRTSMLDFVDDHPQLSDQFARWDLFAPTFPAVHLNRLQAGDGRRMVNTGDSYDSILDADHLLTNPIAHPTTEAPRVP